tara:strand:+ start:110 stop:451 length:342 start_codon:yes stop_codon:yes gene_type:complete
MATITKIKWKDATFRWDNAIGDDAYNKEFERFDYTWEDVKLVEEIAVTGGDHIDLTGLEKDKKKRLIRLIMRRNNIKMYDESKEVKNLTAYAKDIEFIIKEIKAQVKVENIDV